MAMSGHSKTPTPQVIVNPPAAWLGVRNAILWGKGRQYHVPDFHGPLSIKTVIRGSARWSTNEADRLVDESNYLVLNSGQTYTVTIDSLETVETFCLFFRRGLAEDVCRSTNHTHHHCSTNRRLARRWFEMRGRSLSQGDNPFRNKCRFF